MMTITKTLALAALLTPLFAANEKNYTYLALGDSVAFGLDPTILPTAPGQPVPSPDRFVGYPESLAADMHLLTSKKEVNASCPGETAASFWIAGAPDNGCHGLGPQGQPPFKTWVGLHTNYPGTQLEFAVSQLESNKHIDLVTLSIGANDLLLVLQQCSIAPDVQLCLNTSIPPALNAFGQNLAAILAGIRQHYNGTLVLVKYYSIRPDLNALAQALNGVMVQVGSQFGAKFADGYSAFQTASAGFGGDPCAAGLLIPLAPGVCDIDPSPLGRDLLTAVIEATLGGKH